MRILHLRRKGVQAHKNMETRHLVDDTRQGSKQDAMDSRAAVCLEERGCRVRGVLTNKFVSVVGGAGFVVIPRLAFFVGRNTQAPYGTLKGSLTF